MTGFSENEKQIIANVARYHKGSPPKERHPDFMFLSERDRALVYRLGGILRLADALDRDYKNHLKDIKFKREKNVLSLKLIGDKTFEAEPQFVETKKDMFEAAFDCQLKISGNYLETSV
jgi:exopolyphosphatase/guanosine-5'-triphosphate,3'-diphosphate pyrophosphatase